MRDQHTVRRSGSYLAAAAVFFAAAAAVLLTLRGVLGLIFAGCFLLAGCVLLFIRLFCTVRYREEDQTEFSVRTVCSG